MTDERHDRQQRFAPLGPEGQRRLSAAHVLIVGVGATGSALAEGLARAGVAELRLVDRDLVELSNLGRQALYGEADIGLPKAIVARERLLGINSSLAVRAKVADAGPRLLAKLAAGVHLILDGTDNFATRWLINALSQREQVPWIYSGAIGSVAVSLPVLPGETACLACLYPESPEREERCDTAGVLQAAVLQAAALGLAEALKILSGRREAVRRELWTIDPWRGQIGRVRTASPRPDCPVCQGRDFELLDNPRQGLRVARICAGTLQVCPPEDATPPDLAALAARWPDSDLGPHVLELHVDGHRTTLFPDGRLILEACQDKSEAEALYRKILGGEPPSLSGS